jgi:hypothetical protein
MLGRGDRGDRGGRLAGGLCHRGFGRHNTRPKGHKKPR